MPLRLNRLECKHLSWVWGWDRKIHPEDHRLASQGLPSDDKQWSEGQIESIIGVQWGQKNPNPRAHLSSGQASFPTERWTRGLGFFWNHWTPMIDSFSHIPNRRVQYSTYMLVMSLRSMFTVNVQFNLKQRINSALNNEQMVILSKWTYKK